MVEAQSAPSAKTGAPVAVVISSAVTPRLRGRESTPNPMPEGSSVGSPLTPAKATRGRPLVRQELAGALVGALAGFSIAVPVGMLTLAPLGAGFSGIGVAAGL